MHFAAAGIAAIVGLFIGLILAGIIAPRLNRDKEAHPVWALFYVAFFTVPASVIATFYFAFWIVSGTPSIFGLPELPPLPEPTSTPGPFTSKYDTGEVKEEGFTDEYGLPTEVVTYYRSGKKACERTYRLTGITKRTWKNFDFHVLDESRCWYESGKIKSERVKIDDTAHVYRRTLWYANGQKLLQGNDSQDKRLGVQKYWSDTGVLLCEWTEDDKERLTSLNAWFDDGRREFRSDDRRSRSGVVVGTSWSYGGVPTPGSFNRTTNCNPPPNSHWRIKQLQSEQIEGQAGS